MSHYDLYESLHLDKTTSSADILSVLETRIAEGNVDNLGGIEELELAKTILGNEEKRGLYDARLNDPASPKITVGSIRELAAKPADVHVPFTGGENTPGGRAHSPINPENIAVMKKSLTSAASSASGRARGVQAEYKKSSRTAIVLTAVGAFVAGGVIVGLIGTFVGGGSGPVGASGADYSGAEKFANSFLELRTMDETREWVIQNTDASNRNVMLEQLRISDNGSYTGMDAYFGANTLEAGAPVSMTEFLRSVHNSADSYADKYADSGSGDAAARELLSQSALSYMFGSADIDPEDQYFMIPVIGDGEFGEGNLTVVKDNGRWILDEFSRN